jgi:hypothetical protein
MKNKIRTLRDGTIRPRIEVSQRMFYFREYRVPIQTVTFQKEIAACVEVTNIQIIHDIPFWDLAVMSVWSMVAA